LQDYKSHWAVAEKIIEEKELFPIEKFTKQQLE
jgi:hypothetical protein